VEDDSGVTRFHKISRNGFVILVLAVIGCGLIIMTAVGHRIALAQETNQRGEDGQKDQYKRLTGKWMRPDGGYILELKKVEGTGNMEVGYYNPKPINVGAANWRFNGGIVTVFVELRDINYQGSTYTLNYDPESDRLKGKYFQAPTGRTYEVEFLRVK
jgi:hypothetical protein